MKTVVFSILLSTATGSVLHAQAPAKPLLAAKTVVAAAPAPPAKPTAPVPPDLVTVTGKTYKQARVFRVEPDGITYMYVGGMSKFPFTDLPTAVQQQYGYDAAKAAKFARADDEYQQQALQENSRLNNAEIRRQNDIAAGTEASAFKETPASTDQRASVVPVLDSSVQGGLKKIIKMTVADLVTSPFTAQGALVELTGIREVEIKEVAPDEYRLKIRSRDYDTLYATLPGKKADLAQRSKTLFVAVTDPKNDEVTVFGNNTTYHALDTMPQVIWSVPR